MEHCAFQGRRIPVLNELKTLADSIQAAGFTGTEWDDRFNEIKVKGSPCFVVSLAPDGEIADIRYLSPEKAKVLRTWRGGGNGQCFPCFNFQPFYHLPASKTNKRMSPAEKKAALRDLVATLSANGELPANVGPICKAPRNNADAKTSKCLGDIAMRFFDIVADPHGSDGPLEALRAAFGRFVPQGENLAETFNSKILSFLQKNGVPEMLLSNGENNLGAFLFRPSSDVVVFLDVLVPDGTPLATEWGMKTINGRLLAAKSNAGETASSDLRDAFGQPVSPRELAEKLPEVKLPGAVAVTKLRSMSSESKCQTRYGFVDAESFPVGSVIRKAAKIALSWISSPEREGKTWAIAGANELVFAYPKSMPPSPPRLARLMGNGRSTTTQAIQEARFEKYADEALKELKTLSPGTSPNAEIEVFAIKKADKARRKVVFYRNYSLERLDKAVRNWLEGARNIPDIRLLRWLPVPKGEKAQKGTRPVPLEFHAPLPLACISLAYTSWSHDGNEAKEPPFRATPLYKEKGTNTTKEKLPIFDGLELFLGDAEKTGLAKRLLAFLLQGSGTLCVACGNLARKRIVLSKDMAADHLETALPLFGILLAKLNRTKETYMENAPYLIGKFLNLLDGLHAVWCRNVREKDKNPLPPQLLGASLFASFQLNPVQAFANAGRRMMPYLAWATTNSTKDAGLSRWFRAEIGRVASAIEQAGIPPCLSDTDKAEMLLGYLAFSGKNENPDSIENEPQTQGNDHE